MGIQINNDIPISVTPKDIFKKMNLKDQNIDFDIEVPESFFLDLLEEFFEREYLNKASDLKLENQKQKNSAVEWIQLNRLPIHPNMNADYDLLTRWQSALSCLHAWNYKFIFLLLRSQGETKIYLGTQTEHRDISSAKALEQISSAACGSMPGIGLRNISKEEKIDLAMTLCGNSGSGINSLTEIGAITGIPSFFEDTNNAMIQTLDQLAFGIRDQYGQERDYALLVIADPISDSEVSQIIARYRSIGSQIHSSVKTSTSETSNMSETKQSAVGGALSAIGGIAGAVLGVHFGTKGASIGSSIGTSVAGAFGSMLGFSSGKTAGGTASVNKEFLDKFAEYAEQMTEKNIKRLTDGRNFGFWNTGIYVLGAQPSDVTTASGILRAVYSGNETYLEPIRLHLFKNKDEVRNIVCGGFNLVPLRACSVSF